MKVYYGNNVSALTYLISETTIECIVVSAYICTGVWYEAIIRAHAGLFMWIIVYKFEWNFDQNTTIYTQENGFNNAISKMSEICSASIFDR